MTREVFCRKSGGFFILQVIFQALMWLCAEWALFLFGVRLTFV
nr:MAG TPA: hypothetical protein [Caudoviricetes sp.]